MTFLFWKCRYAKKNIESEVCTLFYGQKITTVETRYKEIWYNKIIGPITNRFFWSQWNNLLIVYWLLIYNKQNIVILSFPCTVFWCIWGLECKRKCKYIYTFKTEIFIQLFSGIENIYFVRHAYTILTHTCSWGLEYKVNRVKIHFYSGMERQSYLFTYEISRYASCSEMNIDALLKTCQVSLRA